MDFPTPEMAQALYVKSHEAELAAFFEECKEKAILHGRTEFSFTPKQELSSRLHEAAISVLRASRWTIRFGPDKHVTIAPAVDTSDYWNDR